MELLKARLLTDEVLGLTFKSLEQWLQDSATYAEINRSYIPIDSDIVHTLLECPNWSFQDLPIQLENQLLPLSKYGISDESIFCTLYPAFTRLTVSLWRPVSTQTGSQPCAIVNGW